MPQRNHKRRRKLIKPRFQLKVALSGLGIAVVSVFVLVIIMNSAIVEFADKGWIDARALRNEWVGILVSKLLLALALLVPMTLALGVVLTHRIAGPLYRFELFLNAVMRGEHPGECHLRNGDELLELCELLNKVTEPLRNGSVPLPKMDDDDGDDESAVEVVTAAEAEHAPLESKVA